MKKIWHLVLTGGPCAGKTTAINTIEKKLTQKGYTVLIVPETATELITNGIRPYGNCLLPLDFQRILYSKQLYKESLYERIANLIPSDKIVILYDRGMLDNKSYVSNEEFNMLLEELNLNETIVRDKYDAVFHLVTAALGAEKYYTLANNAARTETLDEARALDAQCIRNWTGHSHLRIIDNSTDFDKKINKLMAEIYSAIGDPVPIEIERKYLIEKPEIDTLSNMVHLTVVDIVQTYLGPDNNNNERRVRKRGTNGNYTYYVATKKQIDTIKRIEIENKISENEYLVLISDSTTFSNTITKKRICFVYENQYFEIDLYDFSEDKAILEIELTNENNTVQLPSFIKVIKEVTDDPNYWNYSLAKSQTLDF